MMTELKAWSIMTVSHGGTVSVIRDLTEREAAKMYERLDPWYGETMTYFDVHPDFKTPGKVYFSQTVGGGRAVRDGDIEIREVFGPPGWEGFSEKLESWPKHEIVWTDDKGVPLAADDPRQGVK